MPTEKANKKTQSYPFQAIQYPVLKTAQYPFKLLFYLTQNDYEIV